jgi:DNA-binding sugar fermentation-stimulating protein
MFEELQKLINMNVLMNLENLVEGAIEKRPSKNCKTPYVADVMFEDKEFLGHTPALGCCGLCDKGSTVLMSPSTNKNTKCDYTIYLSKMVERGYVFYVGMHPKLAELLTEKALSQNYLSILKDIKFYQREKTIMNSRFDFVGVDKDNIPFIMEVKNVPLADYVDCVASEKKKLNLDVESFDVKDKIAYFPDGYRKKQKDTVSPRALKHITELTEIKKTSITRCIMCYVIQRPDASSFQPSNVDLIYRNAFKEAISNGVEIITLQVRWDEKGDAHFMTDKLKLNSLD